MLGRYKQLQDIKLAEQRHQEISRHIYIYIYIYECVCVCACVCVCFVFLLTSGLVTRSDQSCWVVHSTVT